MIGRSMLNLLEYIKQNHGTHFKDCKIDEIESIDMVLAYLKNQTVESNTQSVNDSSFMNMVE